LRMKIMSGSAVRKGSFPSARVRRTTGAGVKAERYHQ
jgi:hypothetical protein